MQFDMAPNVKQDVFNPITLFNTPGAELVCIFDAHNIANCEELLGEPNLKEKTKLSKALLKRAGNILGIGDALIPFFDDFTKDYRTNKRNSHISFVQANKDFRKLRKILGLLKGQFTEGIDILEDIIDFFGVESTADIFNHSENKAALYRSQNGVEPDPINLYAWLRRGELDFQELNLPDYNDDLLKAWVDSGTWKSHIESVEYFKSLPTIFKDFGVGLALVPHLPKTVYGAIRWIDGKPLIEISDRNNDLASCWFTLFHEIGHTLMHRDVDILEGEINDPKINITKIEREANKFANNLLFNGDNLIKAVFERLRTGIYMNANELANEFDVNPLFASYWLLKAQYQPAFQRRIQIAFVDDYQ